MHLRSVLLSATLGFGSDCGDGISFRTGSDRMAASKRFVSSDRAELLGMASEYQHAEAVRRLGGNRRLQTASLTKLDEKKGRQPRGGESVGTFAQRLGEGKAMRQNEIA